MTAPSPAHGWREIETMPQHRQVLVSDGALVKPAVRVSDDTVLAPIPMVLGMWTHWMPLPEPPDAADGS